MITPGLPQGSALSPVLYDVYTVGIISNHLETPGRTLSFTYDILVHRHVLDREEISRSVQAELNNLDGRCEEYKFRIHIYKAGVLWCLLNNHAIESDMPTVYIEGK